MESNNSNVTSNYDYDSFIKDYLYFYHIMYVIKCVIISICLPLTLAAIYSLYFQIKNDHVALIFIINLLISDLIQLCYMIVQVAKPKDIISILIYNFVLMTSVGFMVCIALERYLVIAWPLWYRFRRTVKISLVVCVAVWTLPLVVVFILFFRDELVVLKIIIAVFLLVPFPLLIFFLGGTLKALSAAISVSSDEKRRIVGILVLVLLTYTLLFLPTIIWLLSVRPRFDYKFYMPAFMLLKFSPLADLILYVFMRKGVIDKLLASLCCCRMDSDDNSRSST